MMKGSIELDNWQVCIDGEGYVELYEKINESCYSQCRVHYEDLNTVIYLLKKADIILSLTYEDGVVKENKEIVDYFYDYLNKEDKIEGEK